ncbi:isocitrate lyase/phosphoenolpyruvate mutase family protein [soil metagenome]
MPRAAHVEALAERIAPGPDGMRTLLPVPGCWDGLSALLIEQAGFHAAFLTGAGLSMARLGRPDLGLVTASELTDAVAAICDRVSLSLIVDGDTGFGNALTLQRSVRAVERAGAAAIQIEDQGFPKRCGHLAGKSVVPIAEAVGRIAAALDAREDMLVIARTDAVAVEGIDAALERAQAYREAGADLIFVEGPRTMAETQMVAERFAGQVPLVHNLVEGGVSATDSAAVLARMGFAITLHPLLLLHGLVRHAPGWLGALRADGDTVRIREEIAALPVLNRLVGTQAMIEKGNAFG